MEYILQTINLTKKFGGIIANKDISLSIVKGKITGLIGPNGSGKTTFINQVSGFLRPSSGIIKFKNIDITNSSAWKRSYLGIARTYQRIQLFDRLSVLDNVLIGRKKFYTSSLFDVVFSTKKLKKEEGDQIEKSMNLLKLVKLEKERNNLPSNLPYGKRRLLEIARALATEPTLLLLDEPAAGMTKEEFKDILNVIDHLKSQGITVLLVEHTMEFIRQATDIVHVLNFGEVIASGSFDEIEKNELVISAYLGED